MSQEIEQVEVTIEEAQKMVDRASQLDKLFSNREFKRVILEGYFKDEALRLVAATGDANLAKQTPDILLSIQAIAKLQDYFRTVVTLGRMAAQEIEEAKATLDELREEAA